MTIADIPEDSDLKARIGYYKNVIVRIRASSMSHIGWYTHKNPYGCWICDAVLLLETLIRYLEDTLK